jgi:hypothetical protein
LEGGAVAITSPVPEDEPRKGPPETLILIVFAVLTLAASAFVLQRAEHKALHDPAQKGSRGEVKGLDALSFFRTENLRRVIAKVEAGPLPLVTDIRVSAVRVDVTLVNTDRSSKRELSYDLDLRVRHQFEFTPSDSSAVRPSQIDPAAPERMIRGVLERTRLPASAVDYVTQDFTNDAAGRSWYLFLKQGPAKLRQWVAAPDGSDLRHPGEPSTAQRQADAKRQRDFQRQQRRLKRTLALRTACLRKAADAVAAAHCVQRYPL